MSSSADGSIFLASACTAALSSTAERPVRNWTTRGTGRRQEPRPDTWKGSCRSPARFEAMRGRWTGWRPDFKRGDGELSRHHAGALARAGCAALLVQAGAVLALALRSVGAIVAELA